MMHKILIASTAALALSACTYSTYGADDERSASSEGLVASRHVDLPGDAEFAGMIVNARGEVGQNLDLAGASVRSDADVGGDLTAAGARVRFSGSVGGDADVAAATMHLDAEFRGDLTVAGARVNVDGSVAGALTAFGADMDFRGDYRGPVEIRGEGTDDRSGRAELHGHFADGGWVCASEVVIRNSARLDGEFVILSEERPENLPANAQFEDLGARTCDKIRA